MPTYTDLKILKMDNGSEDTTWGTQTNTNWDAITQSIAGTATVTFASADVTLPFINDNGDQDARNMRLVCTGVSGGARNLNLPTAEKLYIIQNDLADTLTVKTVAGTGIAVPVGGRAFLYCDGVNIINAVTHFAALSAVSPTFTGTPTAPTAAPGTNTTQIATTAYVLANQTPLATILQTVYPVGSIYLNATNATNPGTLLGFGTWVSFGAGRMPVGFNAGDPLFDTAEETGGSKDAVVVSHTHTGTTDSAGAHTHTAYGGYLYPTSGYRYSIDENSATSNLTNQTTGSAGAHTHTFTTGSTGSSGTNANLPPYITVFMWKRIS